MILVNSGMLVRCQPQHAILLELQDLPLERRDLVDALLGLLLGRRDRIARLSGHGGQPAVLLMLAPLYTLERRRGPMPGAHALLPLE